jgi:hypothetical protein
MKTVVAIALLTVLLSSCASIFNTELTPDSVGFGYRYEVLAFRGNKKYAKHEAKKMVRVVAIKIDNPTNQSLKLGENLFLYCGNNLVEPMEPHVVKQTLKQGVAIYLLYSLLWFNKTECEDGDCKTTAVFPIGVPITIGNMVTAGSANQNFQRELEQYNLMGKSIEPGRTVYALVGLPDTGLQPLKVVVKR